jgi:NAD(P)H-dependent flavin oxidoreductase YrpB (nitropropane dioxygenase family)
MPSLPSAAEADSQAEGLGIISKLSSRSRLRKLLDAVEQEPGEPEPVPARESRRPAFGPELLSAIHHHKLSAAASLPPLTAANSNANKQSDAVAGIARLRAGTRTN